MQRLLLISAVILSLAVTTGQDQFDFEALNQELGLSTNVLSPAEYEYTLVEFWASWCAPCRTQNQELQDLLDSIAPTKLQIIGVSLDADSLRWRKAIRNDKLRWHHQYRLASSWHSPLVAQLNIRKLPSNYLVDAKGNVVSTDVTATRIRPYLK